MLLMLVMRMIVLPMLVLLTDADDRMCDACVSDAGVLLARSLVFLLVEVFIVYVS